MNMNPVSKLQGCELVLPKAVLETLNMHPDEFVELFKHTSNGQMEFCAICQLGYDNSITLPDEIIALCGNRELCEFISGRDMVTVRVGSSKKTEMSTRERMATKGTIIESEHPVEFRIYKHICAASKPSVGYVAQSETCALCGGILRKDIETVRKVRGEPRECPRCHTIGTDNFCSHCGLKLSRVRRPLCSVCQQPLSFIQKYERWYCYKCGQYRVVSSRLKKPTCKNCNKELTYIKQYARWYCYNCKKYAPKLSQRQISNTKER